MSVSVNHALIGSRIRAFDWHRPDLERRNSPYVSFFTESDSFADQLRHSGWR